MKYIDIFLGFTKCEGLCAFCNKGQDIIEFSREEYFYDTTSYQRLFVQKESEIKSLKLEESSEKYKICISGYEPLSFTKLLQFCIQLKVKFPNSDFILRTSGLEILDKKIISFFDRIELSLYASEASLHNEIVGNPKAWKMLNNNIKQINKIGDLAKIEFQTILMKNNLHSIVEIVTFVSNISESKKLKIVYPYFFPKKNIAELLPRKFIIGYLLQNINKEVLKSKVCLVNFSNKSTLLGKYFSSITY